MPRRAQKERSVDRGTGAKLVGKSKRTKLACAHTPTVLDLLSVAVAKEGQARADKGYKLYLGKISAESHSELRLLKIGEIDCSFASSQFALDGWTRPSSWRKRAEA